MRISKESLLIALICSVDLVTTIWLIRTHNAAEANPIMRPILAHGIEAFVLVKLALCVGPLAILEYARKHRPRLVRDALRLTIILYLAMYTGGVWRYNGVGIDQWELTPHERAIMESAAQPISRQSIADASNYLQSGKGRARRRGNL